MGKRRVAIAAGAAVAVTMSLAASTGTTAAAAVHARTSSDVLKVSFTDGKDMTVSAAGLDAGPVPIRVTANGAEATANVWQFHSGYTLSDAKADLKKFGAGFGPNGPSAAALKAFRHLLAHTTLYGGIDAPKGTTRTGILLLPTAGTYYVWNTSQGFPIEPHKITVGAASGPQTLPTTDATVTATTNKTFRGPAALLRSGTLTFRNTSTESPHLFALMHVKDGTSRQQVIDAFSSNNPPDFIRAGSAGTDALSNGQSQTIRYSLPAGEYAELCFFPDPQTGQPHAMMGMVRMVRLVDAQTVQARMTNSTFTLYRAPHLHAGRVHLQLAALGAEHTAGVVRMHSGYTLDDYKNDLKAYESGVNQDTGKTSKAALQHLRHAIANVTMYGGVDTLRGTMRGATFVLSPGTYYVQDSSNGAPSAFRKFVVGAAAGKQTLPATAKTVVAQTNKRFGGDTTLPHDGNVTFTNNSIESPHFMFLQHVKEGTTRQQVIDSFSANSPPDFVLDGAEGTDALSSGQSQLIHLRLPAGEYAVMCFFPDPQVGTPHAFMGMVRIVHLK